MRNRKTYCFLICKLIYKPSIYKWVERGLFTGFYCIRYSKPLKKPKNYFTKSCLGAVALNFCLYCGRFLYWNYDNLDYYHKMEICVFFSRLANYFLTSWIAQQLRGCLHETRNEIYSKKNFNPLLKETFCLHYFWLRAKWNEFRFGGGPR